MRKKKTHYPEDKVCSRETGILDAPIMDHKHNDYLWPELPIFYLQAPSSKLMAM